MKEWLDDLMVYIKYVLRSMNKQGEDQNSKTARKWSNHRVRISKR